ncbi:MAG: hypothetical protein E7600_00445 [Ruminococcaceae bacterium]|nr:hypothetical protein [Oscillospiraceae bacterium]
MTKRVIIALILACLLCIGVGARLSPAMDIIADRLEMRRCISDGTSLGFTPDDLSSLMGSGVKEVTVAQLPKPDSGTLMLSGVAVKEGQTISRDEMSELCFSSKSGYEGEAAIVFKSNDLKASVYLSIVSDINHAPETADMTVETQKNIAVFAGALAADPEGDSIVLEIVDYPDNGSVRVSADGQLVYRPLSEYTGSDSFSYKATDVYGNSSKETTVQVKVSRPAAEIYFDDMKNHWAHNSAVKMASTGLMTGERVDGKLCFMPENDMTRGDFLALSLIMTGHEKDIPVVTKTVFADDKMIPANIKSYAQYAYDKGIVSGYDNGDGTVNFESTGSVSRAEAAVITSRILGLSEESDALPSYKDASDIPVWAGNAVYTLSSLGIINGDVQGVFSADKKLSRAEGAQMICNVADYVEDKNQEEKKKEKNLFNLFGLLG